MTLDTRQIISIALFELLFFIQRKKREKKYKNYVRFENILSGNLILWKKCVGDFLIYWKIDGFWVSFCENYPFLLRVHYETTIIFFWKNMGNFPQNLWGFFLAKLVEFLYLKIYGNFFSENIFWNVFEFLSIFINFFEIFFKFFSNFLFVKFLDSSAESVLMNF